jgi:hypothetical protein
LAREQTSLRHCRALIEREWPGAELITSHQRVVYRPRPFTISEDLIAGSFDIVVLASEALICIQVTSSPHAAARRHKIDANWPRNPRYCSPEVWAWKSARHMLRWIRQPDGEWYRAPDLQSPLLKEKAPASVN